MTALEFRTLIDEKGKLSACQQVDASVQNEKQADLLIFKYVSRLLMAKQFIAAAIVLWGTALFDPRPASVRDIWGAIEGHAKVLIQGCGSVGKSYSTCAWLLLRWWMDPEFTNIKIISTTKAHASSNTFSTIVKLHRSAIVKMPGVIMSDYIGLDPKERKAGISVVAVPIGDDGRGRLKGFHPDPRPAPHPILGPSSCVILFMDECEDAPIGIWEGVGNVLMALSGDNVKVMGAYNPKNQTSKTAQNAAPEGGWDAFDVERGVKGKDHWISKNGWFVLRIDGKKTENVRLRKDIHPGHITYAAYREKELMDGGNSVEYFCADEETEALTKMGWKRWFEVNLSDSIWTVNTTTGMAEWADVEGVFSKRYSGKMMSMEGRSFSALVTGNHKWAVTNKDRKRSSERLVLKETVGLARHDLIPLVRGCEDTTAQFSDDFASLIGWVVTDGTFHKRSKENRGFRVVINQSRTANPKKCEIIRSLLIRMGAGHKEHETGGIGYFKFSGNLGRLVRSVTPNKKLTMEFVESLSNSGRVALLEAIIMGDGGIAAGSTRYACTASEEQAGVYSALMSRAGIANTTHKRFVKSGFVLKNGWAPMGCWMWYVNTRISKFTRIQNMTVSERDHQGIVWCPSSKNGTFLARRNGTTYFTGNTQARGAHPPEGAVGVIISSKLFNERKGDFTFIGAPVKCAGVDTALAGRDNCVLTSGRVGMASAFQPVGGALVKFKEPRMVAQADQQFTLPKGDTKAIGDSIMEMCLTIGVSPENLCIDATGNGAGVLGYLRAVFGDSVMGINFSASATDIKILEEDQFTPEELYEGIVSEVWFALAKWMEFGFLAIAPGIRKDPLESEIVSRRYVLGAGKKLRVETKDDYKKRMGGKSPDWADSLSILLSGVRMRGSLMGSMLDEKKEPERPRGLPVHSSRDRVDWMDDSAV